MDDNISRQIAQKLFGKALTYQEQQGKLTWTTSEVKQWVADFIEDLPAAQPEPHYDEWCDSCKEYDKEKHCCPRWNRVIKSTIEELKTVQPEPCEDAVSRLGAISHFREIADATNPKEKYNEGFIDGLEFCIAHLSTMPHVTPKQIDSMTNEQIAKSVANDLSKWLADENDTRSSYAVIYSALILAAQREGDAE